MANSDSCPKVWYFLCIVASGIAVKSSVVTFQIPGLLRRKNFPLNEVKIPYTNPIYMHLVLLPRLCLYQTLKSNTSQNFEGFRCTRTLLESFSNSWKVLHELTIICLSSQLHGLLSLSEFLPDTIPWYTSCKNLFAFSSP